MGTPIALISDSTSRRNPFASASFAVDGAPEMLEERAEQPATDRHERPRRIDDDACRRGLAERGPPERADTGGRETGGAEERTSCQAHTRAHSRPAPHVLTTNSLEL